MAYVPSSPCQVGWLLLLRWSHRGWPNATRGADGAEAAEGVLDLGRREVATAGGAVVRGRRAAGGSDLGHGHQGCRGRDLGSWHEGHRSRATRLPPGRHARPHRRRPGSAHVFAVAKRPRRRCPSSPASDSLASTRAPACPSCCHARIAACAALPTSAPPWFQLRPPRTQLLSHP